MATRRAKRAAKDYGEKPGMCGKIDITGVNINWILTLTGDLGAFHESLAKLDLTNAEDLASIQKLVAAMICVLRTPSQLRAMAWQVVMGHKQRADKEVAS